MENSNKFKYLQELIMNLLEDTLIKLKRSSILLATAPTDLKNKALKSIADKLKKKSGEIIAQNKIDLDNGIKSNLSSPLQKRLKFDEKKLETVINGINDLIKLEDPVNKILSVMQLDQDLILTKVSVPIGVIGVIFESRPDALVQISTLCLKSGNSVILKGGKEAVNTNKILSEIIISSIEEIDRIFKNTMHLIETREEVKEILQYDKYINLIIPRGSNDFVRFIQNNTSIPVLGHADGICHLYIDNEADINEAVKIAIDSKTQYVAVCNALETLLVHKEIAQAFLPELKKEMDKKNVQLIGDEETLKIIPGIQKATEKDWKTEYLDLILSIKTVDNIDQAIEHINTYGSNHTDSIVTKNKQNADKFKSLVDSASVLVNCSTRFSDGFRYGMGAEVGISTNKIHARGPVGLEGLTIYKYILEGKNHIVDDYATGKKKFNHKRLK